MRGVVACVVGLGMVAGCSRSLESVLEGTDVSALELEEDAVAGEVFALSTADDPVLTFTAWGLFGIQQVGTWSSYNVVVVDGGGPETYRIRFGADLGSVVTGNQQLDGHIVTADFFDVAQHPRATFEGTSVEPLGGDRHAVTGDMTLRGTTRSITFEATITPEDDRIRTTATIPFSRWDFGLYADDVDEPGGDGADDEVIVDYDVWLVRGAATP